MESGEDVLGMCKTYFPGVDWDPGCLGTLKAKSEFWLGGNDFGIWLWQCESGDYRCAAYVGEDHLLWSFRGTLSEALAAAAIKWREFATEAMAVVGPLPEPTEKDPMERDEFWAGFYLESERRRDLGLPSNIKAQIEAGKKSVKEMLGERPDPS
jgi:hypothetical protein